MFIKNNTNVDVELSVKGSILILKASEVTCIPDGLITSEELGKIYGSLLSVVDHGPNTESLMKNQVEAKANIIYCTNGSVGLGTPRLFVGLEGKVNVYGSDSKTIPEDLTEMYLPEVNEEVSGLRVFGALPRYLLFTVVSGEPEIILTNCKLSAVKELEPNEDEE